MASPSEFTRRRKRRQAEVRVEPVQQRDHLDVGHRVVGAEDLDAELVVLTEAAGLGALVAEHRRRVPGLERRHRGVLHKGAHDRGRALGTKGDVAPAPILELVHLLRDDVGRVARAAPKDLRVLEARAHDEPEAGPLREVGKAPDELDPARALRSEDVLGPLRGLEALHRVAGAGASLLPGTRR